MAKSLGQTPVAVMGLGRAKCPPQQQQQQIAAVNQGKKDMAENRSSSFSYLTLFFLLK